MKIIVVGAGSIGCYIGGLLIPTKTHEIHFIGRDRLKNALKTKPLMISDCGKACSLSIRDVNIHTSLCEDVPVGDVYLVCVKSKDTQDVGKTIAKHVETQVEKDVLVLSCQNGLSNVEVLESCFGQRNQQQHIIVRHAIVGFNVIWCDDTRFHRATGNPIIIDAAPCRLSSTITRLSDAWSSQGLKVQLAQEIQGIVNAKLVINLNNAINALLGTTLIKQFASPIVRKVMVVQINEALAVLSRQNLPVARVGLLHPVLLRCVLDFPNWLFTLLRPVFVKVDKSATSSMQQDLEAHRLTEIDYLQGAILSLNKHNIETPVIKTIFTLVKHAEKTQEGSPKLSPQQLFDECFSSLSQQQVKAMTKTAPLTYFILLLLTIVLALFVFIIYVLLFSF
mmetsp:Transcript_6045/g.9402  ORF Transcript_6045/g.9402 Transcript_6045/m.9402 type:complete len:393 (-) Transcript_6045:383-1561(-)